jgi:hypothetical protein
MTSTAAPTSTTAATVGVIRALLDQARNKGYHGGALGVRARPVWTDAPRFDYDGAQVLVVACPSALAVREALLERDPMRWLVILTDRDEVDLGAGILTHLVWHRLRTPDPWDAVRHRFQADGIDPLLFTAPGNRDLASGLLAATPSGIGWPPAAGGVLTRGHALAAAARAHLRLAEPGAVIDGTTVLSWTITADASARVAALRACGGDALTDAVLEWMAGLLGAAGAPVGALLAGGLTADVVPLGLVVELLSPQDEEVTSEALQLGREGMARLEVRLGGVPPSGGAVRVWSREATNLVSGLLLDRVGKQIGEHLVARADALLRDLRAGSLAERSRLLPAGLTNRLGRLAAVMRFAVAGADATATRDVDAPAVPEDSCEKVELAWTAVVDHHLAEGDHRVDAFRGAVRLVRWLSLPAGAAGRTLAALVDRHRDVDAWVDAAVSDAASGVGDADLAGALNAVLSVVHNRRRAHDRAFATALADDTRAEGAGLLGVEDVLHQTVIPLARRMPVLLLVLDGMSAAVATEVMASVTSRAADGWVEALVAGKSRRGVALAVLPTLTSYSRTSLLCGELTRGAQAAELSGFERLTRSSGMLGAALFHKKPIEVSPPGQALAPDVAAALDDVVGRPLVACVLNAIDDALDRSDPGGTAWGIDAVRHLRPLLERARVAGRTVVLTADHGHVIERRMGTQRPAIELSSGRSRGVMPPAEEDEVLVSGRRVLAAGGAAVLAVDEDLRYGPLKAGYHGGASPAEVIVPVCILGVPPDLSLQLAPPQEPAWWWSPVHVAPPAFEGTIVPGGRSASDELPLFAELSRTGAVASSPGARLAAAVVGSSTYREQRRLAGRAALPDDRVESLVAALAEAAGQRLAPEAAAIALAEPIGRLRGAIAQLQRMLNVEGYPVLTIDVDGSTLVLSEALLREQFAQSG